MCTVSTVSGQVKKLKVWSEPSHAGFNPLGNPGPINTALSFPRGVKSPHERALSYT